MSELPKSVIGRLRKAPVGAHPTAEQLAAFAERALAGEERNQVVEHLAGCGECRETLFLAGAEEQVTDARVDRVAPRWFAFRWAATAAAVVIAGLLVLVAVRPGERPAEMAMQRDAGRLQGAADKTAPEKPEQKNKEIASLKNSDALEERPRAKSLKAEMDAAMRRKGSASPTDDTRRRADESLNQAATAVPMANARTAAPAAAEAAKRAAAENKSGAEQAATINAMTKKDAAGGVSAAQAPAAPVLASPNASGSAGWAGDSRTARRANSAAFWRVRQGVLESSVDGQAWTPAPIDPAEKILAFSRAGNILAALAAENVFISSDQGKSFRKQRGPWVTPLKGLSVIQGQVLVTDAEGAMWVSVDYGGSWEKQR